MTNETRQRIEYYTNALPNMRQKVMAALSMLIISLIITVTATYAWVTISVNPEVTGMDTTITGNGSLEIALVNPDGDEPAISGKTDSIASGNLVTAANITWGNLVNLAHESYGLDELILRPALLNTSNLQVRPLQGAVYGTDGRISGTSDKYMYTTWDGNQFVVPQDTNKNYIDAYGVRAIASFKFTTAATTTATYEALLTEVGNSHSNVEGYYVSALSDKNIEALSGLMAAYIQSKVNEKGLGPSGSSSSEVDVTEYLGDMYNMYQDIYNSMVAQQDVFVKLANVQLFVDSTSKATAFNPVDWTYLYQNRATLDTSYTTTSHVISLTGLKQFCSDFALVEKDLGYLKTYYENSIADPPQSYYWSSGGVSGYQISNIVDRMVSTATVTVNGTALSALASDISGAMDMLSNANNVIIINNGIIKRYEDTAVQYNRLNEHLSIPVSTFLKTFNAQGDVSTLAGYNDTPSYYSEDYKNSQVETLSGSDPVAEDTYGLAVDLWLRSNEQDTIVLLEGAVVTDEIGTVIGYDGVNRIWNTTNESMLSTNSTTQGSGSCYVFQAATPEDQARSLELLDCFKVAFIGPNGEYYASASMDTDNYYAKNGEVTVPLVVDANSLVFEEDVDGEIRKRYGIIQLEEDEATWITALVYLDGNKITNEEVLIDGELEGSLNIQFGSSASLVTKGSSVLEDETRTINAFVSKTFGGDRSTSITLNSGDGENAYVTLVVDADGDSSEISTITGSFMRIINSTQGTKLEEIKFEKQSDGTWTAMDSFTEAGTYILQSVKVNGLNCTLDQSCTVEVSGYSVKSLTWTEESTSPVIVTTDKTYDTTLSLVVDATNKDNVQPTTAAARFLDESGNVVNATMKLNPINNTWEGTARFLSSGVYTLQYVLLDGEYYSVPTPLQITLNMGITFRVQTNGSPTTIQYQETDEEGNAVENIYPTNLKLTIYDDTGRKLSDLGYDMTLYYSYNGSKMETQAMPLTWDSSANYYTTSFLINAIGAYTFHSLELKDAAGEVNVLTKAEYAQAFYLYPPDVPQYDSWEGLKWVEDDENEKYGWEIDDSTGVRNQFTLGSAATVTVYLKNASASMAQATFSYEGSAETLTTDFVSAGTPVQVTRKTGVTTYYDETTGENITEELFETVTYAPFTFEIPDTVGKEGIWTLESIDLSNVFFDGELHTGTATEDLYSLDMSDNDITGVYSSKVTANLVSVDTKDSDGSVHFGGAIQETHTGTHKLTFSEDIGAVEHVSIVYDYAYQASYITGVDSVTGFNADTTVSATISNPTKQEDGSYLIPLNVTNPGDYTFREVALTIGGITYVYNNDTGAFTVDGETSDILSMSLGKDIATYKVFWNVTSPTFAIDTTNMTVDGDTPSLNSSGNVVMTGYYGYAHKITGMTVDLSNVPSTATIQTVQMKYNGTNYNFTSTDGDKFSTNEFTLNHSASCEGVTVVANAGALNYVYDATGVTITMNNSDGSKTTMTLANSGLLASMPSFVEHVVAPTIEYSVSGVADTTSVAAAVVNTSGSNVVLGKDSSGNIVSLFMDEHKITSGISLKVKDNFDKYTTNPTVSIKYYNDGTYMESYGGYSTTADAGKTETDTATMTGTTAGYVLDSNGLKLRTAGLYNLNEVTVQLNGATYTYTSGGVSYSLPNGAAASTTTESDTEKAQKGVVVSDGIEVYSIKPSVQWNATNPTTSTAFWAFNVTNDSNGTITVSSATYLATKNIISADGYSATLNISVGTDITVETTTGSGCNATTTSETFSASTYYAKDSKTLSPGSSQSMSISGVSAPQISAKLVNGGTNHAGGSFTILSSTSNPTVTNGSSGDETFSFAAGGNVSDLVKVGDPSGPTLGYANVTYLGTNCTATVMSLKYGETSYSITLDNPIKLTQIR